MIDNEIIGMEKQAALDLVKGQGIAVRIEMEEGQHRMLTMDLRPDRLNLTITGGKVTSVRRG